MPRYSVTTPEFETYRGDLYGNGDPPEYGRDYVEVEADTKSKAKA